MKIALASCEELPGLDADGQELLAALERLDVDAAPVVWDAPDVDWSSYDVVVVRGTWDYVPKLPAFLAWADRVATVSRLLNPPPVIRWNTDKHYLAELERAGVPIVPTQFLEPGEPATHRYEDVEHVVKPAVSAGSRDTLRLGAHEVDRSRAHAASLLDGGRAAMVQPYLHAVDEHGETALLFLDGEFSHAMRKGPLLAAGMELVEDLFAQEDMSRREPSAAEREVAEAVLAGVPEAYGDLLYARVDLLPGDDGPQLLELELTEPSLFLDHHPPGAERLADAILRRV